MKNIYTVVGFLMVAISMLLLTGCTAPEDRPVTVDTKVTEEIMQEVEAEPELYTEDVAADMQVVYTADSKLVASETVIQQGVLTTIAFFNKWQDTARFEIEQLNILVELDSMDATTVEVNATYNGFYPVKVNGVSLATLEVR